MRTQDERYTNGKRKTRIDKGRMMFTEEGDVCLCRTGGNSNEFVSDFKLFKMRIGDQNLSEFYEF